MFHAIIKLKNGEILEKDCWKIKSVTYDHGDINNYAMEKKLELIVLYQDEFNYEGDYVTKSELIIKIPKIKIEEITIRPNF